MQSYPDSYLRKILSRARRIAMVGVSLNPVRPSYFVARYLSLKGYEICPVNPRAEGETLMGQRVVASLDQVEGPVDMVDIFRRSEAVPGIVEEALAVLPDLRTVWMQIGVEHEQAAARAHKAGLDVVQDRCPKMEYQRLFGELRKAGINTGIISSRLEL